MQVSRSYNNSPQRGTPSVYSTDIKLESLKSSATRLSSLSPPSAPPSPQPRLTRSDLTPPTRRRSSATAVVLPKRARYSFPLPTRDIALFTAPEGVDPPSNMSHTSYGAWPPTNIKSEDGAGSAQPLDLNRRSSVDERQFVSFPTHTHAALLRRPSQQADARPHSASSNMTTSSLTGAMGNTHISPRSSSSDSPSPTSAIAYQSDIRMQSGMVWTPDQEEQTQGSVPHSGYGIGEHMGGLTLHNLSSSSPSLVMGGSQQYLQYPDYNAPNYPNISPAAHSPDSPGFATSSSYPSNFGYHMPQRPRSHSTLQPPPAVSSMNPGSYTPNGLSIPASMPPSAHPLGSQPFRGPKEQLEAEVRHLRNKVRELELINEHARFRMRDLEAEVARAMPMQSGGSYAQTSTSTLGGLPSPLSPPTPTPSFHASWKARTDARIRIFCSLNRAGNALCAWHDSRRERRAYPPRMAPPGHLNCGCTYEEALFEESLSRHGVGSYHPGENVRMDPALRNPLLKLLQQRYGYRDGDFERDPATGDWIEGEGHQVWEAKALTGASNARKSRGDERR